MLIAEIEHLNTILNRIGDGVISVDSNGLIDFVNQAALRLLSQRQEDMLHSPIARCLIIQNKTGQTFSFDDLPVHDALKQGVSTTLDVSSPERYSFVRWDRTLFPVSITVMPGSALNPTNGGATLVFHDISGDERIDKAKGEFISLISHQLRTPVSIINWYSEKLLRTGVESLTEEQEKYAQEIFKSTRRIGELVTGVVNASRADLDRLRNKHEEVELWSVVQEVARQLASLAHGRGVTVDVGESSEPVIIEGSDKEYIEIILQNLTNNAIKYSSKDGHVAIGLQRIRPGEVLNRQLGQMCERAGVVISIQDEGIGIPDDQKAEIFSKLFRAKNAQALDIVGVGLGLYIAKTYTKFLGGSIWFESKVHSGTTFYVYLPTTLNKEGDDVAR